MRGFLFPQKKIKVKVIEEQYFQTNVTPQSVKLTVNDVGFEFHLLTMHSMSIDPQNIQQEQKHANFEIHDQLMIELQCTKSISCTGNAQGL